MGLDGNTYFLISAKTSDREPLTGMTWLPLTDTKHLGWQRDTGRKPEITKLKSSTK